jgi:hypothetical protein
MMQHQSMTRKLYPTSDQPRPVRSTDSVSRDLQTKSNLRVATTRSRNNSVNSTSSSSSSSGSYDLQQSQSLVSAFDSDSEDEEPIARRFRKSRFLGKKDKKASFFGKPPSPRTTTQPEPFVMYRSGEEIRFVPQSSMDNMGKETSSTKHNRNVSRLAGITVYHNLISTVVSSSTSAYTERPS